LNKKRFLILLAVAALILSACGPEPEPTMSPEQVQGTAMGVAMTMVAETQAAIPTATPIPPTDTATPTIPSSPTPTFQLPLTLGAIPTNTLASTSGDPCNQPLTTWDGESARLITRNNTKPKGLVTLSLYFTTDTGQCGYIGAQFDSSTTLTVPTGVFSAGAFVDGKKDFKVFGGGRITSGSWSLWIENDSIILKAGCAPNC
jgi:hypothetical protein